MSEAKVKVFVVTPKIQSSEEPCPVRLIRAKRINQVHAFLLNELNITPASQEDCIDAGKAGIDVEEASE